MAGRGLQSRPSLLLAARAAQDVGSLRFALLLNCAPQNPPSLRLREDQDPFRSGSPGAIRGACGLGCGRARTGGRAPPKNPLPAKRPPPAGFPGDGPPGRSGRQTPPRRPWPEPLWLPGSRAAKMTPQRWPCSAPSSILTPPPPHELGSGNRNPEISPLSILAPHQAAKPLWSAAWPPPARRFPAPRSDRAGPTGSALGRGTGGGGASNRGSLVVPPEPARVGGVRDLGDGQPAAARAVRVGRSQPDGPCPVAIIYF